MKKSKGAKERSSLCGGSKHSNERFEGQGGEGLGRNHAERRRGAGGGEGGPAGALLRRELRGQVVGPRPRAKLARNEIITCNIMQ